MSIQNFMGRIDLAKSAGAAADEPYIILAQIDDEAQDNVQTIRVPVSSLAKLVGKMELHLLGPAT